MTDFITTCIKRFKERHELSWKQLSELTGIAVINFYRLKAKGRFNKHPKFWPQIVQFFGPQFLRGADNPGELKPGRPEDDPLLAPFLTMHYADVRDPVASSCPDQSALAELEALREELQTVRAQLKAQKDLASECATLKEERKSLKSELNAARRQAAGLKEDVELLEKGKAKLKKTVSQMQETIKTLQEDL